MIGVRRTAVKDFWRKILTVYPQSPDGASPGGACGFAVAPPAPSLLRLP